MPQGPAGERIASMAPAPPGGAPEKGGKGRGGFATPTTNKNGEGGKRAVRMKNGARGFKRGGGANTRGVGGGGKPKAGGGGRGARRREETGSGDPREQGATKRGGGKQIKRRGGEPRGGKKANSPLKSQIWDEPGNRGREREKGGEFSRGGERGSTPLKGRGIKTGGGGAGRGGGGGDGGAHPMGGRGQNPRAPWAGKEREREGAPKKGGEKGDFFGFFLKP